MITILNEMWDFNFEELQELQPQIDRLYEKKAKIDQSRPLPNAASHKIREQLSLEWTYNSNSIEGNTLNLQETKLILEEGIAIGGKSLREHFEVLNHEKAIGYLYGLVNTDYTLRSIDILNLHSYILKNIEDEYAGSLRNGGVRIVGANFTPPSAKKILELFNELVEFVNHNPLNVDDLVLATLFHHKLV